MSTPQKNAWNREAAANVEKWLMKPDSSYFDFRRYLSSFDLGISFLIRGQFQLFVEKCVALGSSKIEVKFQDQEAPNPTNAYGIVVTFNPDEAVLQNLRKLSQQMAKLIIVDNSPVSAIAKLKGQSFLQNPSVLILPNQNKNGLAGAINKGMREVFKLTPSGWIFWFDQDTEIHDHFIDKLQEIIARQEVGVRENSLFGVNYEDGKTEPLTSGPEIRKIPTVITSGSFMRVENLRRVGLYIDELFIDSLDHDYCMRARRAGMEVHWISTPLMKHSLGQIELRSILWKHDVIVTNHAPFRWYYFSRNLIFTAFEGLPTSLPWFFEHGYALLKNYIKAMILERDKGAKTLSFLRGIGSGVLLLFGLCL